MHAVLYSLAVIGALVILWKIYEILSPDKAVDQAQYLDVDRDLRENGSSPCIELLSTHLAAPLVPGNHIELLVNGDRIFPPMLEAIRRAEHTINFLTFIYWKGEIAQEFASCLGDAAERGVEVRVLLDAFGAKEMDDRLVESMERSGCDIQYFHELRPLKIAHYNRRTHRKVLVVDGAVGFTGGVGIAEEWTGDAENRNHWRDNHFRITGPAVRSLQGAFAENWREASGEVLTRNDFFPDLEPAGTMDVVPIVSHPGGSVSAIAFSYWMLLRCAQERVWINTPYFLPSRTLTDELANAARRGVDVAIILPGDNNDHAPLQYGAETYYQELLDAGVRLFRYDPTMIHAKVLIIDREDCIIGSSNFDNRSFDLNYEISMGVRSRRFNETMASQFEADLERSTPVTEDHIESRSLLQRVRNHLALAARPQL